MAIETILKLTGADVGTADLNSQRDTALLENWRPRVGKRRLSKMGGRPPYTEVEESIPIRIFGATEADCYATQQRIAAVLDQAWRWKQGGGVSAVLLEYSPRRSSLGHNLKTAVWGTPDGTADMMELPATFNKHIQAFEINPVNIPLTRMGYWLGDEEAVSAESLLGYPTVISATFSESVFIASPVTLTYQIYFNTIASHSPSFMLLATNDDEKILFIEAETGTGSGTNTADLSARNILVRQFTASASAQQLVLPISAGLRDVFNYCHIFASVQRTGSSSWYITPKLQKYIH